MARLPPPRWLGVGDLDESDEYFSLPFDFYSNALQDFDSRLNALANDFLSFAAAKKRDFESRYRGFIQNPEKIRDMGVRPPRQPAFFWVYQKRYADLCFAYIDRLYSARDSFAARRAEFQNDSGFADFDWCLNYCDMWVRAVLRVLEYATFWVSKIWALHFDAFSDSSLQVAFKPKFHAKKQVGW